MGVVRRYLTARRARNEPSMAAGYIVRNGRVAAGRAPRLTAGFVAVPR